MSNKLKNKISAFFLALVFSLNTAAGFACSVGIDLGYNKHHHEHGGEATSHHHHHETSVPYAAIKSGKEISEQKDDCCSADVVQFTLLDKSSVSNLVCQLQVPVLTLPFSIIPPVALKLTEPERHVNSDFQFVRRSCFLNDIDPQIAIRRFQI